MTGAQLLQNFVTHIINPAILLVFAAGFFLFVWGLVQFLRNLEKGSDNEEGKQHMLWGIIGMFIMASVWGIIALLDNTFDLGVFRSTPDVGRLPDINFPAFR